MSMFSTISARVGVAARDGLLERVEVHAHQVDRLDPLLGGGPQVLVVVAPRQQARVQPRVQRLHAPVHHLGKAGEVLDRAHRDARRRRARGRCRRWRRSPRPARPGRGRSRRSPVLSDTDSSARRTRTSPGAARSIPPRAAAHERRPVLEPPPARPSVIHGRDRLAVGGHRPTRRRMAAVDRIRRGFSGSTLSAPRANRRTASGSSACSSGRSAASTSSGSRASGSSTARWQDHRPGVDAGVDEVDGHAEHLDPVGQRLLDRVQAGEGRQQRGMHVDDGARESARGSDSPSSSM